jgi:glycine cleavage system H protein
VSLPEKPHSTAQHQWIADTATTPRVGGTATIGITDYATQALGDVVYVSLPEVGATVTAGEPCGEVESTKSVSDIYCPADGEVTEVNPEIDDDPGLVNSDPYGAGWLFKIALDSGDQVPPGLLTATEYEALTQEHQ